MAGAYQSTEGNPILLITPLPHPRYAPPTPTPLSWTARPAGWDYSWPPVVLNRLEDPPPPLGYSRDPLTRGLSWPPSFKEKSFTPSRRRHPGRHPGGQRCDDGGGGGGRPHLDQRDPTLTSTTAASPNSTILFIFTCTGANRQVHANYRTLDCRCNRIGLLHYLVDS